MRTVLKVHEARPHVVDHLINGEIALVINTPLGRESHEDDGAIRRTALKYDIPCITTLSGAMAAAEGIAALRERLEGAVAAGDGICGLMCSRSHQAPLASWRDHNGLGRRQAEQLGGVSDELQRPELVVGLHFPSPRGS